MYLLLMMVILLIYERCGALWWGLETQRALVVRRALLRFGLWFGSNLSRVRLKMYGDGRS